MHARYLATLLLSGLLLGACNRGTQLDTRTFALVHLDEGTARTLVTPYIYADREGAAGLISSSANLITVRETPDNLDKIARVLQEYDKPQPGVRLHFQIIEADGRTAADPRISEVETQLRSLFRFEGYRLVGEANIEVTEGGDFLQMINDVHPERAFSLQASVGRIRLVGDSGVVQLQMQLHPVVRVNTLGPILATTVNARVGQTLVLGTAQSDPVGEGTIVVTLKPELVTH